jgi:hypothetical protein
MCKTKPISAEQGGWGQPIVQNEPNFGRLIVRNKANWEASGHGQSSIINGVELPLAAGRRIW